MATFLECPACSELTEDGKIETLGRRRGCVWRCPCCGATATPRNWRKVTRPERPADPQPATVATAEPERVTPWWAR